MVRKFATKLYFKNKYEYILQGISYPQPSHVVFKFRTKKTIFWYRELYSTVAPFIKMGRGGGATSYTRSIHVQVAIISVICWESVSYSSQYRKSMKAQRKRRITFTISEWNQQDIGTYMEKETEVGSLYFHT